MFGETLQVSAPGPSRVPRCDARQAVLPPGSGDHRRLHRRDGGDRWEPSRAPPSGDGRDSDHARHPRLGVNVTRLIVFCVSAFFAGIAGRWPSRSTERPRLRRTGQSRPCSSSRSWPCAVPASAKLRPRRCPVVDRSGLPDLLRRQPPNLRFRRRRRGRRHRHRQARGDQPYDDPVRPNLPPAPLGDLAGSCRTPGCGRLPCPAGMVR